MSGLKSKYKCYTHTKYKIHKFNLIRSPLRNHKTKDSSSIANVRWPQQPSDNAKIANRFGFRRFARPQRSHDLHGEWFRPSTGFIRITVKFVTAALLLYLHDRADEQPLKRVPIETCVWFRVQVSQTIMTHSFPARLVVSQFRMNFMTLLPYSKAECSHIQITTNWIAT